MTCMSSLKLGGAQEVNEHVGFQPGVPVKPMLAKPTTGVSEVPALTACCCEAWAGYSCVSFAISLMHDFTCISCTIMAR